MPNLKLLTAAFAFCALFSIASASCGGKEFCECPDLVETQVEAVPPTSPIVIDGSIEDWNAAIAANVATNFLIKNNNEQECSHGSTETIANGYVVQNGTSLCFLIKTLPGVYFAGAPSDDFFLLLSGTCALEGKSKIVLKNSAGISANFTDPHTTVEFCVTDATLPAFYKIHIQWTLTQGNAAGETGSTRSHANKGSCQKLVGGRSSDPAGELVEDPHIISWDGLASTVFHEGDFVLAHVPSTGLAVHGRFCKAARGPWAPWTCAVAVRCAANEPMVEIVASEWNDVRNPSSNVQTVATNVKRVTCPSNGLNMLVVHRRFHRHPYVNLKVSLPDKTDLLKQVRGLLGTANGIRGDDLQFRDGSELDVADTKHFIAHDSALVDAVHASWAVRPEEQLFSKNIESTGGKLAPALRGGKAMAQQIVAKEHCRLGGLQTEVDLAICSYDLVAAHHLEGAKNLAESRKIMEIHA